MLYLTDDMAIRDAREYRLVLIPGYGFFLIFVGQVVVDAARSGGSGSRTWRASMSRPRSATR